MTQHFQSPAAQCIVQPGPSACVLQADQLFVQSAATRHRRWEMKSENLQSCNVKNQEEVMIDQLLYANA